MQSVFRFLGALTLAVLLFAVLSNVLILVSYGGYVADQPEELSLPMDVGLVLGTSRWTEHGTENQFFAGRVKAAARLYEQGYVRHLILSGDNAQREYNEPLQLQRALLAMEVEEEDMTLDYAGFRTLDSVVRSREVFGQDSVLIISQGFHLPRAIFIARKNGIKAYGFAAESASSSLWVRVREYLARPLSVADIYLFRRRPKFLGEQETITIRKRK